MPALVLVANYLFHPIMTEYRKPYSRYHGGKDTQLSSLVASSFVVVVVVVYGFCVAGHHRSGPHHRSGRSSYSSASSKPVSIEAAIRTDRLLTFDQFSTLERAHGDELFRLYSEYMQKHQRVYLQNFFNKHKKEKW